MTLFGCGGIWIIIHLFKLCAPIKLHNCHEHNYFTFLKTTSARRIYIDTLIIEISVLEKRERVSLMVLELREKSEFQNIYFESVNINFFYKQKTTSFKK